jgi:methylphosphotriester-DNA--protein-cysteine methyltransferase
VSQEPHYVANGVTLVFHRPGCSYARHHAARHCKRVESRWDSLKLGYSPCRWCRP